MKTNYRIYLSSIVILLLFSLVLSSKSYGQKKNSNNCKYEANKIDEFTKKSTVLTETLLLYREKNTAETILFGDRSSSFEIDVAACNLDGINKLFIQTACCSCSKDELFVGIDILLQNDDVLGWGGEYSDFEIKDGCSIHWKFYEVADTSWVKLKTFPVKKIRVTFSNHTQGTFEVKEKMVNNIMKLVNCIDVLGLPRPKTNDVQNK